MNIIKQDYNLNLKMCKCESVKITNIKLTLFISTFAYFHINKL